MKEEDLSIKRERVVIVKVGKDYQSLISFLKEHGFVFIETVVVEGPDEGKAVI